jgi:bacillithiol biosynthesis cysteine-adding enzyme BshC
MMSPGSREGYLVDANKRSPGKPIDFAGLPDTRKLFLDFLAGRTVDFYEHPFHQEDSYAHLSRRLRKRQFDRLTLCETLRRQNRRFGAGPPTMDNIDKLGKPETLAVVTGQQVMLFGGPLYTFYKAALAVKVAATNCRLLQTDVVPVFWLAADDADLDEATVAHLPTQDDKLREFRFTPKHNVGGRPMSEVMLDDGINALLGEYHQTLPQTDFTAEIDELLRECYQPGRSLVDAFGMYLLHLFGDDGLILIDSSDTDIRRLAVPIFAKEADLRHRSSGLVAERNRQLTGRGYHLQVTRPEHYTNLFYHAPGRQRIDLTDSGFRAGDRTFGQDEMEKLITDHPEQFSPNVFLRPIVQSHLFPTLIHFVGPAEAAYLAQIVDLYGLFKVEAPIIYPRFSATLVEPRIRRVLDKYGLAITDFAGDAGRLINRIMSASFPEDMESKFYTARARVRKLLQELIDSLDQNDEGLITTASKSTAKIDREIGNLEKKTFAAHKKKHRDVTNQLQRAALHLFPNGGLQERILPLNYYLAKFGRSFVEKLTTAVDCDSHMHYIIELEDL